MEKREKKWLQEIIEEAERQLFVGELNEKLLQRSVLLGEKKLEIPLGQAQAGVKAQRKVIAFYREQLEDN